MGNNVSYSRLLAVYTLFGLIFVSGCQPDRCLNQSGLNPDTLSAYEARVIDSARYIFYASNGHLKFTYKGHEYSILEFDAPVAGLHYNGDTLLVSFDVKADTIINLHRFGQEQDEAFKDQYASAFGLYVRDSSINLAYKLMFFQNIRANYDKNILKQLSGNTSEDRLKEYLSFHSGEVNCWLKERAIARGWLIDKPK